MKWTDELRRLLERIRGRPPEAEPESELTCHEAVERIFEWLDGELDPPLADQVGEHLRVCARCYPRLAFETSFREALDRMPQPDGVSGELEDRILESLRAEGFTAP